MEKIIKAASDCHGDHNTFWKKIKQLRGHNNLDPPYIVNNNNKKITDKKEQTTLLAETWENTFRSIPNNNTNWTNLNKVTNWINNNRSKTSPYQDVKLSRLTEGNLLTSPINTEAIKQCIKNMKKRHQGNQR